MTQPVTSYTDTNNDALRGVPLYVILVYLIECILESWTHEHMVTVIATLCINCLSV